MRSPPTFAPVKFYANISDCAGAVNLAKGDVKTGIMPVTKLARLQHKIKSRVFSKGDIYCEKMFMIRFVQKVTFDHDYSEDFQKCILVKSFLTLARLCQLVKVLIKHCHRIIVTIYQAMQCISMLIV